MWLSSQKQKGEDEDLDMRIKKTGAIQRFEEAEVRLDEATEEVKKAKRISAVSLRNDEAALSQNVSMARYEYERAAKALKDIEEKTPDKVSEYDES